MRRVLWATIVVACAWVCDSAGLFAQQTVSSYQWTTLAGRPVTTAIDGPATSAIFGSPAGMVTLPDDSVLVADSAASAIRRVTADGTVSTYAGQLHTPGWADGPVADARFTQPVGLARAGNGDVFVAENTDGRLDLIDTRIRRITSAGVVATLAEFTTSVSPLMAVDPDGALYVASGTTVTRIATDGTQTTPFGTSIGLTVSGLLWHPTEGLIGFGGNPGTVIFSIRSVFGVTELAGAALGGAQVVDGVGSAARMGAISGWTVARSGRVYFEDTNTIRAFDPGGQVTTLAGASTAGTTDGTGSVARFNAPTGLAVRTDGSVVVGDTGNRVLRLMSTAGGVTTLAGADAYIVARDGVGTSARFARAAGIDRLPNGDLVVADLEAHAIRRVTPAGVVTTFAGALNVGGFANGTGTDAKFNFPIDVAVAPDGRVFVADYGNHAIRVIAVDGAVTTLAGPQPGSTFNPGTGSGFVDGTTGDARFNAPMALAVAPSGDLYVSDHFNYAVRVIRSDGSVATVWRDQDPTLAFRARPGGIAWAPDGALIVGDSHFVRRVTLDGGSTVLAGERQGFWSPYASNIDGAGTAARFIRAAGVDVDTAGDAYVADDIKVRRSTSAGVTTSLGGEESWASVLGWPTQPTRREADGVGSLARFAEAWGIVTHTDGRVWIGERGRIRVGTPVTGGPPVILVQPTDVSTSAGSATTVTMSATGIGVEYVLEALVERTNGHPFVNTLVWEEVIQPSGNAWVSSGSLSTWRPTASQNRSRVRMVASNGFGQAVSNTFRIMVTGPPSVAEQVSGDRTLRLGQNSYFEVTALSGAPQPTFQWQTSADGLTNWTTLSDSAHYTATTTSLVLPTGVERLTSRLTVTSAPLSLNGLYVRAVATNPSGSSVTPAVQVTVAAAVFTQQPANAAPEPGASATFTAVVDALGGTATYQWQSLQGSAWTNLTDGAGVSGSQTASLTITNATSAMSVRLVVTANGGTATSRTATLVPTTLTFTALPTSLTFVARRTAGGFERSVAQTVAISMTATSGFTASWSVTSAPAWISTTRTTLGGGWPTGVVEVSLTSGYDFGAATSVSGTVTISGTATTGSGSVPVSASVAVTLTIQPESANALPFGNLDTPASGATGLAGAVAVTGWALDDIGVTRVEIWRDCIENIDRSRGACRATPNNDTDAVYVGDALFVSGARPDVASQFSSFPQSNRAGWGLMVLTNMLPHVPSGGAAGGQGTFQLSAYAVDTSGAASLLGRSLVTVDNDNSQLPFGTIDSPASGGVLVGQQLFTGWGIGAGNRCLTSFRMYVDGVLITSSNGLVLANQGPRSDVAALFPNGCGNSGNRLSMGMAFYLNGVAIPNGRHTVSFEATDTSGNVGQFGSRFFDVLAPVTTSADTSGDRGSIVLPQPAVAGRPSTTRAPLRVRIGGADEPEAVIERGTDGVYHVTLPVGARLQLDLGGAVASGAQLIDGRSQALPGGSHLDTAAGVFSWEPPLGFLGTFDLVFETETGAIRVAVRIATMSHDPISVP
jgi:NHL repeat